LLLAIASNLPFDIGRSHKESGLRVEEVIVDWGDKIQSGITKNLASQKLGCPLRSISSLYIGFSFSIIPNPSLSSNVLSTAPVGNSRPIIVRLGQLR
jgi:hypothetical protein